MSTSNSEPLTTENEVATCRGCGRALRGKPYYMGGIAYIPETGARAPANHFGGYVCSESCDRNACLEMLSSMPGAGPARRLDTPCEQSVRLNWSRS